jgi:hypothetical protein
MSKYVITITPDPPTEAPGAETIVRLDVSTGRPRVRELIVRSGEGTTTATELANIDFAMLVRAFSGAGEGAAPAADPLVARVPEPVFSGRATAATEDRSARGRAGRPTSERPAPERAGRERRAADRVGAGEARAYRRMPDPDEAFAVYQELGTITNLAEHYGVPRHTAQGWATRLRRMGYEIGRS